MDYLSKLQLPLLDRKHIPAIALGLSTAALLTYALKPRYAAETSMPTLPGLSHVPRSTAADHALHLYPADLFQGGEWVSLPWGRVRVWVFGPESGQKVVLVHGFSVPAIVLKDVASDLVKAGFRVLTYDLYGRGHSDYVKTEYSATLYTTQLALILQYVGWSKPALVGYSMGGSIVAAFASHFPHVAGEHIVLIASAGVGKPSDLRLRERFLSSRLGVAIVSSSAFRFVANLFYGPRSSPSLDPIPPTLTKRLAEFSGLQALILPGYLTALASSLIYGPFCNQHASFTQLSTRKTLIICGAKDPVCPIAKQEEIHRLAKRSRIVAIEGGTHFIPITHTDQVSGLIVSHLSE